MWSATKPRVGGVAKDGIDRCLAIRSYFYFGFIETVSVDPLQPLLNCNNFRLEDGRDVANWKTVFRYDGVRAAHSPARSSAALHLRPVGE